MTATEYTDPIIIVDEADREIGIAEKLTAHEQHLLHRAFSIFIFRTHPTLALLMQRRALSKYHSPGLWTNTCCSHPKPGETIIAAGERRLEEELGMKVSLQSIGRFHYMAYFPNGLSENEIDHVLIGEAKPDQLILPNPEEVCEIRWMSLSEVKQAITETPQQFTPWLQSALAFTKTYFRQQGLI